MTQKMSSNAPLRTLAIRIATINLASDSAITIARFRPSKRCFAPLTPAKAEDDEEEESSPRANYHS